MSKSSQPSSSQTPVSLVRTPFQESDKKVKKSMRSVPDTLRTAAIQLLERVRVGLDIPSRAEVMDLADRIGAIAEKLEDLESKRSADSRLVEELRVAKAAALPRTTSTTSTTSTKVETLGDSSLAKAAASLSGRPKARAAGPGTPKAAKTPAKAKPKAKAKAPAAKTKAKSPAAKTRAKAQPKASKAKPAARKTTKGGKRPASKSASKAAGSKKR
jgi:hypothetical protein